MSFIDRLTSLFRRPAAPGDAPEWRGWNRALRFERLLQASFEAAGKRDDLWTLADFKDADATLLPDKRRLLRSHSRYEAANNPLIDRIIKVYVTDLAGAQGPWLAVATGNEPIDRLIEAGWARWWKQTGMAAKLHSAMRAEAVDGETVAIRTRDDALRRRAGASLDVVLVECDRLANPNWMNANTSDYIDGVHLDPFTRKPVAYDILKAHPGTEYVDQFREIFEARTFPAAHILHAFRAGRPEQHRGVPRATAALPLSGMHRKFLSAKVDKAALQAAIAFAIKSSAPPETEDASAAGEGDDGTLWQTVKLPNRQGLGIMFPDGYEPAQFKTDGDSQDVDPFNRIVTGLYAGCFSMPLGRALGQYTSGNYAGIRGELLPYHRALAADRVQIWEPLWLGPLYEDFIDEFASTQDFQRLLAALADEQRRALDLYNTNWQWGGEDLVVDPSREREAQKKKLMMGLSNREAELDAPDIDAHDARAAVQLGIVDQRGAPDVMRYRRIVAASIHGAVVESPPPRGGAAKKQTRKIEANCGTGKGGFQSGNSCARGGSAGKIALGLAALIGTAAAVAIAAKMNPAAAAKVTAVLRRAAKAGRSRIPARFRDKRDLCAEACAGWWNKLPQLDLPALKLADQSPKYQKTRDVITGLLGPGVKPSHLPSLVGAVDVNDVEIGLANFGTAVRIDVRGNPYGMTRKLFRGGGGKLVCENTFFKAAEEKTGLALRIYPAQIKRMAAAGFDKITMTAARHTGGGVKDDKFSGYAIWPKFGFDGPLKAEHFADFPAETASAYRGVKTLQALYNTPGGKDAWELYGTDVKLEFDLAAGSRHWGVLNQYLERKGVSID